MFRYCCIILCFGLLLGGVAYAQGSTTQPPSALGMNLSGAQEEMPFLNVLKLAGGWYTEDSSGTDTGEERSLYSTFVDSNHYPTSLMVGGDVQGGPMSFTCLHPGQRLSIIAVFWLDNGSFTTSVSRLGRSYLLYTGALTAVTAGTILVTASNPSGSGAANLFVHRPVCGDWISTRPSIHRLRVTITGGRPGQYWQLHQQPRFDLRARQHSFGCRCQRDRFHGWQLPHPDHREVVSTRRMDQSAVTLQDVADDELEQHAFEP